MDTTLQSLGIAIEQIVENVFSTVMGLEVQQCGAPMPPRSEVITSSIVLMGAWKGAVLVECGLQAALLIAGRMTGDAPTELNEDVRDALGEVANMIGGNLKSMLPGGVELSLPSVVWGTDYSVGICHAGTAQRWVFSGPEITFAVVLVEVR